METGLPAAASCDENYSDSLEDLTQLCGPFTDEVVVKALQRRYSFGRRLTRLGPLLLSVNTMSSSHGIRALVDTGEHDVEINNMADRLVQQLNDSGLNQCLLLHGITASGKTFLLHQIVRRLFTPRQTTTAAHRGASDSSPRCVAISAVPHATDAFKHCSAALTILQPLTCAATGQNPDSSRAALHIEAQMADSAVYHCKVNCLLFDQTRLCNPQCGERNFHIFYQFLAGLTAEEREKLHLASHTVTSLRYLNNCPIDKREVQWNEMRYNAWKLALAELGIPLSDIARILAAILLLGNVGFVDASEDSSSQLEVFGHKELKAAASLLGVSGPALYGALTKRSVNLSQPHQSSSILTDATNASESRNRLTRALYTQTLRILTRRFNSFKRPESRSTASSSDSSSEAHATDSGSIHLLDLGGFEATRRNRFEQLAANMAAERAQRWYEYSTLQEVAAAAMQEGVPSPDGEERHAIEDNASLVDLLMHPYNGVGALLNSHSGSKGFPDALKELHAVNDHFFQPNAQDRHCFGIRHTVTRVLYDPTDFPAANDTRLPGAISAIFQTQTCSFAFACFLFRGHNSPPYDSDSQGQVPRPRHGREPGVKSQSSLVDQTLTFLRTCETAIRSCEKNFILCLKPNFICEPLMFDRTCVAQQVRAFNLVGALNQLSCHFSQRLEFAEFERRAAFLLKSTSLNPGAKGKERCRALVNVFLHAVELQNLPYRDCKCAFGTSSVFINEDFRQQLQALRTAMATAASSAVVVVVRPKIKQQQQQEQQEQQQQQKCYNQKASALRQQKQYTRPVDSSLKSQSLSDLSQICSQQQAQIFPVLPAPRLFRKPESHIRSTSPSVSAGQASGAAVAIGATNLTAASSIVATPPPFSRRHAVRSRSRTPDAAARRRPILATASQQFDMSQPGNNCGSQASIVSIQV